MAEAPTPQARSAPRKRRSAAWGVALLLGLGFGWATGPGRAVGPGRLVAGAPSMPPEALAPAHIGGAQRSPLPLAPTAPGKTDDAAAPSGGLPADLRLRGAPAVPGEAKDELSPEVRARMQSEVESMTRQIEADDKAKEEAASREAARLPAVAGPREKAARPKAEGPKPAGTATSGSVAAGARTHAPPAETPPPPALDYFEHGRRSIAAMMLLDRMKPAERRAVVTRLQHGESLLDACAHASLDSKCRAFVADCAKDRVCYKSLQQPEAPDPSGGPPGAAPAETAALRAPADARAQVAEKPAYRGGGRGGGAGGGSRFGQAGSMYDSLFKNLSKDDRDKLEQACGDADSCEFWSTCRKASVLVYEHCLIACKKSAGCVLPETGR